MVDAGDLMASADDGGGCCARGEETKGKSAFHLRAAAGLRTADGDAASGLFVRAIGDIAPKSAPADQ